MDRIKVDDNDHKSAAEQHTNERQRDEGGVPLPVVCNVNRESAIIRKQTERSQKKRIKISLNRASLWSIYTFYCCIGLTQ